MDRQKERQAERNERGRKDKSADKTGEYKYAVIVISTNDKETDLESQGQNNNTSFRLYELGY
jgi:hypothetical protein